MIRNVVIGRLPVEATDEARTRLQQGLDGIAGLRLPGLIDMKAGLDAALRDGSWSFAITNDWSDADSYWNYDKDEEHNRYRAMIVAVCEQVVRVQIDLP